MGTIVPSGRGQQGTGRRWPVPVQRVGSALFSVALFGMCFASLRDLLAGYVAPQSALAITVAVMAPVAVAAVYVGRRRSWLRKG